MEFSQVKFCFRWLYLDVCLWPVYQQKVKALFWKKCCIYLCKLCLCNYSISVSDALEEDFNPYMYMLTFLCHIQSKNRKISAVFEWDFYSPLQRRGSLFLAVVGSIYFNNYNARKCFDNRFNSTFHEYPTLIFNIFTYVWFIQDLFPLKYLPVYKKKNAL